MIADQWAFIEKAAANLGVGSESVRKWRVRGVPHQWRLTLVELAERDDFPLDRGAFDNPPGPKRAAELSNGEAA